MEVAAAGDESHLSPSMRAAPGRGNPRLRHWSLSRKARAGCWQKPPKDSVL